MRLSATTDKLETGILIFVTQAIFRGCRLHVTGGLWRIWQTFLRPTDNRVGNGNCIQAFSYMFEAFSGT